MNDETIRQIEALIAESGAEVSIAMQTLDGKTTYLRDADTVFHAASTMKIAVMIALFERIHAGDMALDDIIPVTNEFSSVVDGSMYQLELEHDDEKALYDSHSQSLRHLCELMITVSSNLATNLLIEKVGVTYVQQILESLGADAMQVKRGLEDLKAFERGLSNTTTAHALLIQLEHIAQGKLAGAETMIDILKRQKWVDAIPAGVPNGIAVANKTGEITQIHHDAAIVYAPDPFILVILTRGIDQRETSAALIADITHLIYER